jgi:hypothetical protein
MKTRNAVVSLSVISCVVLCTFACATCTAAASKPCWGQTLKHAVTASCSCVYRFEPLCDAQPCLDPTGIAHDVGWWYSAHYWCTNVVRGYWHCEDPEAVVGKWVHCELVGNWGNILGVAGIEATVCAIPIAAGSLVASITCICGSGLVDMALCNSCFFYNCVLHDDDDYWDSSVTSLSGDGCPDE